MIEEEPGKTRKIPNPSTNRREARNELRTQSSPPDVTADVMTVSRGGAHAAPRTREVAQRRGKRRSSLLCIAITTVVIPGLFATVAIPAYAFAPVAADREQNAAVALEKYKQSGAQTLAVDATASTVSTTREAFGATTPEELAAAAAAVAAAAEAAQKRARTAVAFSYSGPSAAQHAAAPSYPGFDLSSVAGVGQQYIGVPYVFGGATPAGFDCSGFIKYVYAQFGVSLPHSVSGQAAAGTRISTADARPGDLVIMSGHDGIYMGDGKIMDAPRPGKSVSIRPIWTSDYYIVRIGI